MSRLAAIVLVTLGLTAPAHAYLKLGALVNGTVIDVGGRVYPCTH